MRVPLTTPSKCSPGIGSPAGVRLSARHVPVNVAPRRSSLTVASMGWLEQAADEGNLGFYLPSVDPNFDAVREHPRFKAVMKRANLAR